MNAGAFEREIMPYVHSLDLLDENGTIYTLKNNEISYSYRTSNINEKSIIISVNLLKQKTNFDIDCRLDLSGACGGHLGSEQAHLGPYGDPKMATSCERPWALWISILAMFSFFYGC